MSTLIKIVDTVSRFLERLGGLITAVILLVAGTGVAIGFLHSRSVGAWVPVAVGVPLLVLVVVAFALGLHVPRGAPATSQARAEYEKRLLTEALGSVQQAIGSNDYWDLEALVERGVLGPVRGLLVRTAHEDVRLVVLVPTDDPPVHWRMRWTAGHRPESVKNYTAEIDRTLAGIAFRRGEYVDRGNVGADPDFIPNPKQTRPFTSLVAIPLRIDEHVVGVLSVVSTVENAFSESDVSFIRVIGAVLDVLLAAEFDFERLHGAVRNPGPAG
jgi:GAF domain-containing protein